MFFKYQKKIDKLSQINNDLTKEEVWSDLELSQNLNKEKSGLEKSINNFLDIEIKVSDALDLLMMAEEESDSETIADIHSDAENLELAVSELEFSRMFTNKMDPSSAYVEIQSGSGGTEAQIGQTCS